MIEPCGNEGLVLEYVDGPTPIPAVPVPSEGTLRIGRDVRNEIVLEDDLVSGVHARIECHSGRVVVVDAGSRNGVHLGGERIDRRELQPGDLVRLGQSVLRLSRGDSDESADRDTDVSPEATARDPRLETEEGPLGPRMADPAPGAVPGYLIDRRLARSGMGVVYAGHRADRGLPVAIKMLRPDLLAQPHLRERFLQEVEVSRRLEHPNIVRFLDAGRLGEFSYLVNELVIGRTLADLLREEGPVAIPRALRWALELASALEHAHGRKVLHRDLKPGNVMVESATDRLRVLDFGLGRELDTEKRRLTATGQMMGTVLYASPEQLTDAKRVGPATDIYGLGTVLYTLLCGQPPFPERDRMKTVAAILRAPLCPVRDLRPEVPAAFAAIVERALARDPGERFQDARTLRLSLEAVVL